jgi:hypothetical protein
MAFFNKVIRNLIKPNSSPGPHLLPDNGIRSDKPGKAGMTIIVTKGAQQALDLTKRSLEETDTSSSDSMSGKSESKQGQTEDLSVWLNADDIDLYATGSPAWAKAGVIVTTWSAESLAKAEYQAPERELSDLTKKSLEGTETSSSDSIPEKSESKQGQTEDFGFGLNADGSPSWAKPPVVTTWSAESLTRAEYEVAKRELSTIDTLSASDSLAEFLDTEQENTSPQLEMESVDFDEAIAGSLEQQDSLDKFLDSPCWEEYPSSRASLELNPTSSSLRDILNVNESESGEPGLVHPQTTIQVEKVTGRNSDCTGMPSEEQINVILPVNESESGEEPGVDHPQTTVHVPVEKLAGSNSDYMASEEQINVSVRLFEMGKTPPGYDKSPYKESGKKSHDEQDKNLESTDDAVQICEVDGACATSSSDIRHDAMSLPSRISGDITCTTDIRGETFAQTKDAHPIARLRASRIRTLYCHDEYSAYYY